jgi:F0F1-type ATP synthase assembly protein I
MPQPGREGENREAYRYASLGMQFAGGTLLFAGIGFLLDKWLQLLPLLTIAGLLVGGGLSFFSVYRKVISDIGKGDRGGRK